MELNLKVDCARIPPGLKLLELGGVKDSDLIEVSRCPVCHGAFRDAVSIESTLARLGDTQVLSRGFCFDCGYFGVRRTFSSQWIDDLYRKTWGTEADTESNELSNSSINERTQAFISKYVKDKQAAILDAGAGFGSSILGLHQAGYTNVQALELSTRRARVLKKKFPGLRFDNIPVKDIQKSGAIDHEFDAIYMWHVFEHVSDIEDSLQTISNSLKLGGYFFVAVPNLDEEHHLVLAYLHVHLHSFFPGTLEVFLARFGLKLVEQISEPDGSGIQAMYQKVSNEPIKVANRMAKSDILNKYHAKLFRDFQLMYLIHELPKYRKNFLLGFHDKSAAFGTCLMGYPLSWVRQQLYRLACSFQVARHRARNPLTIVAHRIALAVFSRFPTPYISVLFSELSNWPNDPYPFRLVFNSGEFISIRLKQCDGQPLRLWVE